MTLTELQKSRVKIPVLVSQETVNGKNKFIARDNFNNDWSELISYGRKKVAIEKGGYLQRNFYNNGKDKWIHIDKSTYDSFYSSFETSSVSSVSSDSSDTIELKTLPSKTSDTNEVISILNDCYKRKPKSLIMSELKWKYLVRSALRGKNILMVGPSGCGKTMAARTLVSTLERPFFDFNLGATQDPRMSLIGNIHFDKNNGTFFNKSTFIKAIETPNSIILLDEVSRAHPEAWNILMSVLDEGQRYLRIDEDINSPTIKVAEGVCFIGTANVGNEYTSTRVMDRALLDRFTQIEMDTLTKEQEYELYTMLYPSVSEQNRRAVSEIVEKTRTEIKTEDPKLSTAISTRMGVEIVSLLNDNFNLMEACEVTVFPFYSSDGGADSEKTYIKQIVQKYLVVEGKKKETSTEDTVSNGIFTDEEIESASD